MREITVIYDGQCQLCENSINWLSKGLTFTRITFQSGDLASFNLTRAQCEKQVHAIEGEKQYAGVSAVIFLLRARGNKVSAFILKASGPIGATCYKLIAANRKTLLVRGLSKFIKRIT
jgi:predicted DCC family thiol-disulfide oxidoreductase YuxK